MGHRRVGSIASIRPLLRWVGLAIAIAYLLRTLSLHWNAISRLQLRPGSWGYLTLALGVTVLAQGWAGWVWSWILQLLGQPVSGLWCVCVYLRTNLWKYLPGNIWHFYGRLAALHTLSIPTGTALAGVIFDPILMAAAALLLGLLAPQQYRGWTLLALGTLLTALHPRCLNPWMIRLSRAKVQGVALDPSAPTLGAPALIPGLSQYPITPLVGAVGFVLLRGLGFGLVVLSLYPLKLQAWPSLISGFSLAWFLGLVVPGAPGGVGIFEAAALGLLRGHLPTAVILAAVASYRLISTLAETLGYGAAVVAHRHVAAQIGLPGRK